MMVPRKALYGRCTPTSQCNKGVEQKRRRLVAEDMRESAAREFQAYRMPIKMLTYFKYLGRVMKALGEYCPEVVGNFRKAQKSWGRLIRILVREGDSPRVSGMFFKAVVKAVLLFRLETWVTNPCMGRSLGGGFQHRLSRWITGRQPNRQVDGSWEYLPLETAMQEAGF